MKKRAVLHALQTPLYDTELIDRGRCLSKKEYYLRDKRGRPMAIVQECRYEKGPGEVMYFKIPNDAASSPKATSSKSRRKSR